MQRNENYYLLPKTIYKIIKKLDEFILFYSTKLPEYKKLPKYKKKFILFNMY